MTEQLVVKRAKFEVNSSEPFTGKQLAPTKTDSAVYAAWQNR